VTAYGKGPVGLLGCEQRDRRRRENRGVAFSLIEGSRSVGAIVVFAPPELVDRRMNDYLVSLGKQAGRVIGRALSAQVTEQRGLIDDITGQPNREGLEQALRDMVGTECSLVCADIDQLAEVDPGMVNAVLRQVATIFRNTLRDYDVPARIEGEGFALFLPDTVLENAVKVADRVRVAVSESQLDLGRKHTFTCSLGVASVPDTVSDVNDLLTAAEAALEKAKAGGRNRVVAG
jgi:diguanylate cyclase (GGDEF)-like protein